MPQRSPNPLLRAMLNAAIGAAQPVWDVYRRLCPHRLSGDW